MKKFKFNNVSVSGTTQTEAARKLKACLSMAANFDLHTLEALEDKGPGIFNGKDGPMVRKYLGL